MTANSAFFDKYFPQRIQRALVKCIFENYKESSRYCFRHFGAPQAKDLSGVYRRARIEDEFAGISALYKELTVTALTYQNNTGYYNEISCGEIKLTQSCISDKNEVPRQALYRSTLASAGQLDLFESSDDGTSRYLYAILTHGVDLNSPKRNWPAFISVQFPNAECTAYLDDGIDLMARFPEIVAEYIPKLQFGAGATVTKRRRKKEEGA
ncbi:MAG: hypothetical protein C5B51_01225 [Terriglobia bacterium]|nr:MAG: hypothetical protein C5B51_01225 [Terriglobia bacterium]